MSISSISTQSPNLLLADTLAAATGKTPSTSGLESFLAQFQQLQQPSTDPTDPTQQSQQTAHPHRHHHHQRPTDQYNNLASLISMLQAPTATNITPPATPS